MLIFSLSRGEINDGTRTIKAYSGAEGIWKNNPDLTNVLDRGAIPLGLWLIGTAFDDAVHGPCVMRLTAAVGTDTKGRTGLLIHGDSKAHPGCASEGCVCTNGPSALADREYINSSLDKELFVTE